jgi:hypothetical protein
MLVWCFESRIMPFARSILHKLGSSIASWEAGSRVERDVERDVEHDVERDVEHDVERDVELLRRSVVWLEITQRGRMRGSFEDGI